MVNDSPSALLLAQASPADTPAGIDKLAQQAPENVEEAVRIDPAFVLSKLESWVVEFQRLLPNIVVAIVIFLIFVFMAWLAARGFRRWADRHSRSNLGLVLGALVKWLVIFAGLMLSLTIVIPSMKPGDLIAGLGVGSVAIGFAFKEILQNWLAGLLILLQRPFDVGDQIIVNDYEGTVEGIHTRATVINTYDGRRAIIPNADVYSTAVIVNTVNKNRRSDYDIGIGYGSDIQKTRRIILETLDHVPEVEHDPAPEVLVYDLAPFTVNLRIRWWTDSRRSNTIRVRGAVLEAVKAALDREGVELPFPTQVVMLQQAGEGGETAAALDGQQPLGERGRSQATAAISRGEP